MSEQHTPKNPIKPPLHSLQPSRGIPRLPEIESRQGIAILTDENWSARVIANRHIKCLRQIITPLIEMNHLPNDLDQVVFDNVVIEQADLSELEIPFRLHFQDVFFLSGLNMNGSCFPHLDVSGYIGYGLSLVETQGQPMINLVNLEADQVHVYGGKRLDHLDVSDSTIGTLTVASTMVVHQISLRDSAIMPGGLWLEALRVGQGIWLSRCSIHRHIRIHDISCAGDIQLEVCALDAPLSTRNSTCVKLSLSESVCSGRLDFRGLLFQELDVSNTSVPGQLLLDLEQLQLSKSTAGSAVGSYSRHWDIPPRLSPRQSSTLRERVATAEQLITLRENFRRIPTAEPQERYCAYQLANSAWQFCRWRPMNELTRWTAKQAFGYLLFPSRMVRTMILFIIIFTGLFFLLATLDVGRLSFSDGTSIFKDGIALGISRCLYFSTLTFSTSVYGDIYPVGIIKAVAAIEAFAGLVLIPLFTVSLARRLFRW